MIHAMRARLAAVLPIGGLLAMLLFGSVALAAQSDSGDRDSPEGATTSSTAATGERAEPDQAEAEAPSAVRDAEPGTDAQRAETAAPPGGKPTSDVFVPTEEISEDYAVSFPVDI